MMMTRRLRARLLPAFAALTSFTVLPVQAQLPAPDASAPGASGRPASSAAALKLDAAYTGDVPSEARGASVGGFSVAQFGAEVAVPLPSVRGDLFPVFSFRYRHYALDRDAVTPLPERLQSLSAALTVSSKLTEDWSFLASASPGVHHAGSEFSSKGFGVGLLAIASRQFTSDFRAGFGFVYNSLSKGTGRIIPVATFRWTPAPRWRVTLGFPRSGVTYSFNPEVEVEFAAEADFGSFYVTDDPLPGGRNQPVLDRTRLEYQSVRVGPAVAWRASSAFSVRASVGAVPVLNADYHQRNYRVKAGRTVPYASAALEWKF
jgi:hypothetical protein